MKLGGLILMLISFTSVVNLFECNGQKPSPPEQGKPAKPSPSAPATKEQPSTMNTEIKELGSGAHCAVFESFVFVARDPQSYAALKNLNINVNSSELRQLNITLPQEEVVFFKTHAVIAAFLGQRRTGGFAMDITQGADGVVQIAERKPKGMVTMALTAPFKIVAVPVKSDEPLVLSLDETWRDRLRTYRLKNGSLTVQGGFGGIREESSLDGILQIMRAPAAQPPVTGENSKAKRESLITIIFDLTSKGKRHDELRDVASGTVPESGEVRLSYLNSYKLSRAMQSPFRATGQFTPEEQEISLTLETVADHVIFDNFSARASVKATAITPPPANRAISGNE